MRSGLLSDLVGSGYELFLEGDRIRYRYLKPGEPPAFKRDLHAGAARVRFRNGLTGQP